MGFLRYGPRQHEVQGEEPWGVARRPRLKKKLVRTPLKRGQVFEDQKELLMEEVGGLESRPKSALM